MQGGEFRCWSSLLFSLVVLAMLALPFAACIAGHTKGHFTGRPILAATNYISEFKKRFDLSYKVQ